MSKPTQPHPMSLNKHDHSTNNHTNQYIMGTAVTSLKKKNRDVRECRQKNLTDTRGLETASLKLRIQGWTGRLDRQGVWWMTGEEGAFQTRKACVEALRGQCAELEEHQGQCQEKTCRRGWRGRLGQASLGPLDCLIHSLPSGAWRAPFPAP